jgi:HTH-like domain
VGQAVSPHPKRNAAQTISSLTGLTTQQALEQENRRLKRELEIVRQEREILKAATKFFLPQSVRFTFIRDHTDLFEIAIILRVLSVSKSGFYAWLKRLTSPRAALNAVPLEEIKAVHNASRGSYGSPRVTAALRRSGARVSRHRVVRLMRTAELGRHRDKIQKS